MTGRHHVMGMLPRLMLLLAVVVGVGLMHTLGHVSGRGSHAGHMATVSAHQTAYENHHAGAGVALAGEGEHQGGLDPMSVCLAVLAALGILAGARLRLLVDALSGTARRHGPTAWLSPGVRGPPPIPVALAMKQMTVLRT